MTRHTLFNLCILAVQLSSVIVFEWLDMPKLVMIANMTCLSLIVLAIMSFCIPKCYDWWTTIVR